jgi:hypothetical protein
LRRCSEGAKGLSEQEFSGKYRAPHWIATNKVESYLQRLADLKRSEPQPDDTRIFPMYFAPVVVTDAGRRVIQPMRYTCRLEGKHRKFPGTYNAFGAFLTVSS